MKERLEDVRKSGLKKPYFYSAFVLNGTDVAFNKLKGEELDNTYRYNALRKSLKRF